MIGDALQKAIYAALTASPAVVGGRIYDQVPRDAVFPYITIGDEQVVDDGNACGASWEVYSDVHIWSRPATGSKLEAKIIATAVVARIEASIAVSGFTVLISALETARFRRDPDGETEHGIITMRHALEPV